LPLREQASELCLGGFDLLIQHFTQKRHVEVFRLVGHREGS
jgi:hypothetical protein